MYTHRATDIDGYTNAQHSLAKCGPETERRTQIFSWNIFIGKYSGSGIYTFCVYEIRGNMGMMHSKSYYPPALSFLPSRAFVPIDLGVSTINTVNLATVFDIDFLYNASTISIVESVKKGHDLWTNLNKKYAHVPISRIDRIKVRIVFEIVGICIQENNFATYLFCCFERS